jgi:hypothetical protein
LTSIPFEIEITTHLTPQLDGLRHRKQPLQAVKANPLQLRGELKFRTIPISPPFQRHRASIAQSDLKSTIGPFLIETKARSSRKGELKVSWLNTNFGWVDKPNAKVNAMQKLTIWARPWHPKLPLLIAAEVDACPVQSGHDHQAQMANAGERINPQAEFLNTKG